MTCVGVAAASPWRVDALRFPSYTYPYPSFKERQQRDVHHAQTASSVPCFRRMDEEQRRRIHQSEEAHNISTRGRGKREMDVIGYYQGGCHDKHVPPFTPAAHPVAPRPDLMVRPRIHGHEYAHWRHDSTPVVTTRTRSDWNYQLHRCPERFDIELPRQEHDGQVYFDGAYALRYLQPWSTHRVGLEAATGPLLGHKLQAALPSAYRDHRDHHHVTNGRQPAQRLSGDLTLGHML